MVSSGMQRQGTACGFLQITEPRASTGLFFFLRISLEYKIYVTKQIQLASDYSRPPSLCSKSKHKKVEQSRAFSTRVDVLKRASPLHFPFSLLYPTRSSSSPQECHESKSAIVRLKCERDGCRSAVSRPLPHGEVITVS